MEVYYCSLLTVILLLQKTKNGFWLTLLFIILIALSSNIIDNYILEGNSFYESVYKFEVVSLFLLMCTYPLHENKWAIGVIFISFLYNYIYTVTDSIILQSFIYNNYETINIILFECIAALCFIDTKLHYYVKDKFKREELC